MYFSFVSLSRVLVGGREGETYSCVDAHGSVFNDGDDLAVLGAFFHHSTSDGTIDLVLFDQIVHSNNLLAVDFFGNLVKGTLVDDDSMVTLVGNLGLSPSLLLSLSFGT